MKQLMLAGSPKVKEGEELNLKIDEMLDNLRYPVYCSVKLDGIRCCVSSDRTYTRSLKEIPNNYLARTLPRMGVEHLFLDGELISGKNFQETCTAVMSYGGKPKTTFYIFDCFKEDEEMKFEETLELMKNMNLEGMELENVKFSLVEQVKCYTKEEVLEFEQKMLAKGHEGIMLRNPNGIYKHGRSTVKEGILLKVKRFEQSEAEIIDFEEQMTNLNEAVKDERGYSKRSTDKENMKKNGKLGALIVREIGTERMFNVGSGLDDKQRQDIWNNKEQYKGKIITFKHFTATGVKELPRHPVFLGFRDKVDM